MRFLRAYWARLRGEWKEPGLYFVLIISFIFGGLFSAIITGIIATLVLPLYRIIDEEVNKKQVNQSAEMQTEKRGKEHD